MDSNQTDKNHGQNTVIAHSDYVEVVWDGPQGVEKVQKTNAEALAAAEQLKAAGKTVRISLDIQNHPLAPNMGAFREVLKMFGAVEISRLSISGNVPSTILSLITTVIASFSKQLEVKYFPTQPEAVTWLMSDKSASN